MTDKIQEERVNHPSHYTWLKDKCGVEVIDITRQFSFDEGNALKYILRKDKKELGYTAIAKRIEDLQKAVFYLNDHIRTLQQQMNDDLHTQQ